MYNKSQKSTIMLLLDLDPAISHQVPRSRGISVIHKFFKCTMIPEVELELDLRADVFSASDESDTLQYNRLKKYHPPRIPLLRLYAVKIHYED